MLGIAWLGLIGAAFTYLLWFRGLSKLEPAAVASLGFLSPLVATLLGWGVLGQNLTPLQIIGMVAVLASVWLGQRAQMAPAARGADRSETRQPLAAFSLRRSKPLGNRPGDISGQHRRQTGGGGAAIVGEDPTVSAGVSRSSGDPCAGAEEKLADGVIGNLRAQHRFRSHRGSSHRRRRR